MVTHSWMYFLRRGKLVIEYPNARYQSPQFGECTLEKELVEKIVHALHSHASDEDMCKVTITDGVMRIYTPRYRRKFPPKTPENVMLEAEYKSLLSRGARKMWRENHTKDMYGRWINMEADCSAPLADWNGEIDETLYSDAYMDALDRSIEAQAKQWEQMHPEYDPNLDF